jgi:prevent-host-death family protein
VICGGAFLLETPVADPVPIDLREADRRLTGLVGRVETTGEGYVVLRDSRPVARLLPAEDRPRRLTPEQEAATARLLSTSWPLGVGRFDREEAHAERLDRIGRGGR